MAANEEKTEMIPDTLPLEVWGLLALQANDKGMMIGDYVIDLAMREAAKVEGMTMCADHWLKYLPEYDGVVVTDPDGWDRQNYEESWAEEITRQEMSYRMLRSTSLTYKKS